MADKIVVASVETIYQQNIGKLSEYFKALPANFDPAASVLVLTDALCRNGTVLLRRAFPDEIEKIIIEAGGREDVYWVYSVPLSVVYQCLSEIDQTIADRLRLPGKETSVTVLIMATDFAGIVHVPRDLMLNPALKNTPVEH